MLQEHILMHSAPGACSNYALGAVYIQIMLLEHIEPGTPGAAVPEASAPGA